MPLTTAPITVRIFTPAGDAVSGVKVRALLSSVQSDGGSVVPAVVQGKTGVDGSVVLNLWPNALGSNPSYYTIQTNSRTGMPARSFRIYVPSSAAADADDLQISSDLTNMQPIVGPVKSIAGRVGDISRTQLNADGFGMVCGTTTALGSFIGKVGAIVRLVDGSKGGFFKWQVGDFSAQIAADTYKAIYVAATADTPVESGAWVRDFDPEQIDPAWWGADPALSDNTARLQACINFIDSLSTSTSGGGTMRLHGIYKVQVLDAPDTVSIVGEAETESGFTRIAGAHGPTLISRPKTGRVGGVSRRQNFMHFTLDGDLIGVIKTTGLTTTGSTTLASIADLTGVAVGYAVEGVGIPRYTRVVSIDAGAGTVVMNQAATEVNSFKTKIVFRRAVTISASGVEGSKTLTTADSVAGIEVGMRSYGSALEVDEDDLSQWSRVLSVSAGTIVLDRPARSTATFDFTAYVKNDGILLMEADQAVGYDETRAYGHVRIQNVRVTQAGGTGILARARRSQVHMVECRSDSNYGKGIAVVACNDSYFMRASGGSNWEEGVLLVSMATPRWSGECWQTYQTDKHHDLVVNGVREFTLQDSDVNGRVRIIGKGLVDEPMPICYLSNVTFKYTSQNMAGDGGFKDAYVWANGCHVNVIGGGFKPSRTENSRPNYLAITTNGGRVHIQGQHWSNNPALAHCPYQVAITDGSSNVIAEYIDDVTGKRTVPLSDDAVNGTVTQGEHIKAINGAGLHDQSLVYARGRLAEGDGGGGMFRFHASSTAAADSIITFVPIDQSVDTPGRFIREDYYGTIYAEWAGISPSIADNTAALQACVDAMPTSGGRLELGTGVFNISHLRLDGTSGNKTNVTIVGRGPGLTRIRKLDNSAITGNEAKRQSVIYWLSGHRMRVQDLTVEGNYSRGGASPPIALSHTLGNAWPSANKIRSCAPDGTSGNKLNSTDRILKVTALGAGQTSSAVNVSVDIAAGYVVDVTDQPWNYTTQTGYNNAYGADDEFQWGHGVYGNGLTEATSDCEVLNVHATDCRHGGIVIGSGPLYAGQKGYGSTRALIQGCHSYSNQGSNFGGGYSTFRRMSACSAFGGTSSGIRLDDGCDYSSITGCTVDGGGDADNGGINLYQSNDCSISGCTVLNAAAGVWINSCNGCAITACSIYDAFGSGLTVYNSQNTTVTSIQIESASSYGIKWVTSKLGCITSCILKNNGGSGIYIQGSNACTVTANQAVGNGTAGDANNAGIELLDADNNILTGNKCIDPNGASGTQNYGIHERGTSYGNLFFLNSCASNKVAAKIILPASYDLLNPLTSSLGTFSGMSASGALVRKSGSSTIANATNAVVTFGAETYDTATVHDNSTNNSRLTVPVGIKACVLSASVTFDPAHTNGVRTIRLLKNGATFAGMPENTVLASTTTVVSIRSPALEVTAGDYFEVQAYHTHGSTTNIVVDDRTWFCMDFK